MKLRKNTLLSAALILAMSISMTACGKKQPTAAESTAAETVAPAETAGTVATEQESASIPAETYEFTETAIDLVENPIYKDASYSTEERVADLMQYMTLREKIGQMLQPERNAISSTDIKVYAFGSILSGGGAAPSSGNTAKDWYNALTACQQASMATRLAIPVIYGVDSVHGNNNVYGTTVFPHNIGIGATGDTELAEKIAEITAIETHAIGANYTFAPCLGNAQNETWGRTYECFSEKAEVVAKFAEAYVKGLQHNETAPIAASAKHFIGEGYTFMGLNQGDVMMSQEEFAKLLEDEHLLVPYQAAIEQGVMTVMASYNSIDGVKCHGNKWLLTDVLRDQLGFKGIVISDYDGIDQIKTPNNTYEEKVLAALDAGVDLFMEPNDWKNCYDVLVNAVQDGIVSIDRINLSVERILTVKFDLGLFEAPYSDEAELDKIGIDEHREVARQAVRESLVLLKNDMVNDEQTVMEALADYDDILVVGKGANDIGTQCGGWTISWTGAAGNTTIGTTILEGIQNAAGDSKTITYSEDASEIGDQDVAIVVLSEVPYSESGGDRTGGGTLVIPTAQRQMVLDIKEAKPDMKIIILMVTGRPISFADVVEPADAIIAAWLPGTEGEGVADVLFGDYDFTGHLEFTWPWSGKEIDKKFTDESKVLFPYGSGLKKSETITLPEAP